MSPSGEMHRRSFLVGASVAGGGLALGFAIPSGADLEHPATHMAEINCWVTIAPDDAVTIRIARAEMSTATVRSFMGSSVLTTSMFASSSFTMRQAETRGPSGCAARPPG